MRVYLKYFLVMFTFVWLIGFYSIFFWNNNNNTSAKQQQQQQQHQNNDDKPNNNEPNHNEMIEQQNEMLALIDELKKKNAHLEERNRENEVQIAKLKQQHEELIDEKVNDKNSDKQNNNPNQNFSEKNFEPIRRKIFQDIKDLSNFVNAQLDNKNLKNDDVQYIQVNFKHRISVLLAELYNLSIADNIGAWRQQEAASLTALVKSDFDKLQNPSDCEKAKKLVCDLGKACGFGCQMHHAMYCFITAYFTNRTLILESNGWRYNSKGYESYFKPLSSTKCPKGKDERAIEWNAGSATDTETYAIRMPIIDAMSNRPKFLPLTVPKVYLDKIDKFHGDPFVWWSGQVLNYLMRFNDDFEKVIAAKRVELKFERPCVGVHIRRTDKIGTEAAYHGLDEYMKYVDEFYDMFELTRKIDKRNVYLASDEQAVFDEAKANYKSYNFIYDEANARTAQLDKRYSPDSAQGVILDIYFLSQCDYLVCTFSSQVCRMAYELMQARYPDASWRFKSLDDVYYFGGQNPHNVRAIFDHEPNKNRNELEMKAGDLIGLAGNHWNGYCKGRNRRTNTEGFFPTYKTVDVIQYY